MTVNSLIYVCAAFSPQNEHFYRCEGLMLACYVKVKGFLSIGRWSGFNGQSKSSVTASSLFTNSNEQFWGLSVCLYLSLFTVYLSISVHLSVYLSKSISVYLYLVESKCVCGATSCSNSAAFAVFCTYSACDEMDSGSMRKWSRTWVYFLFVTGFTGVRWAANEGTGSQPVCGGLSAERDKDFVIKIWVWVWNWQLNTKVKENAASLRRLKNYLPNKANYCWQLLNRNSAVVTFYQLTFRFSSSHPGRRWFFSRRAFTSTQTSSLNHRGVSAIKHLNNLSQKRKLTWTNILNNRFRNSLICSNSVFWLEINLSELNSQ